MAIKSKPLGLYSLNFWKFLFSMRLLNGEYFKDCKLLTWHGFDEFGWNDPNVISLEPKI